MCGEIKRSVVNCEMEAHKYVVLQENDVFHSLNAVECGECGQASGDDLLHM